LEERETRGKSTRRIDFANRDALREKRGQSALQTIGAICTAIENHEVELIIRGQPLPAVLMY